MELKPGSRWKSAVCEAEFAIVRPPKIACAVHCGGAPLVPLAAARPAGAALDEAHAKGSLLGKRYVDDALQLEVLCTKSGRGSLAVDGRPLAQKDAKRLPSSD
jgi:hypothetical protein